MSFSRWRRLVVDRRIVVLSIVLLGMVGAGVVARNARQSAPARPLRQAPVESTSLLRRLPEVEPDVASTLVATTGFAQRLPPVEAEPAAASGADYVADIRRLPTVEADELVELNAPAETPLMTDVVPQADTDPELASENSAPLPVTDSSVFAGPIPRVVESDEAPTPETTRALPPSSMFGATAQAPSAGIRLETEALTWWEPIVTTRMRPDESLPLSLDLAVIATLRYSPRVRAISDRAIVREFAIEEADAKFDPRTFMDTRFSSTSDPVGNSLTTGGSDRFIDSNLYSTGGIRKLTSSGAQLEASQRLGWQDTNSLYFIPADQGTARLSLTITQPLLKGAGQCYQRSTLVLAEIDAAIAHDQLRRDLQNSLVEVHRLYWELYVERATLLQRARLLRESEAILKELHARQEVDVLGSQIVRAKAAHARREVAITRGVAAVKNCESRLRAMISDPAFMTSTSLEIVTSEVPSDHIRNVELTEALGTALEHRPEMHIAIQETRLASKRMEVAQHELRPTLDLIVGSYLYGLNGDSEIGRSFGDQFSTGRPSYWAGVQFDAPWQNRAAQARMQQRRVELRQITHQLQAVTANVRAEVEIAVREIDALTKERENRAQAIRALRIEVDYLTERWRLLPAEGADAGIVLEDILTAQERVADAEQEYVRAQAALQLAHIELLRVTGQLLAFENIVEERTIKQGLPTYRIEKAPTGATLKSKP